jgi:hypothetical protein
MMFSAVLFAAGHLPISILLHKMPLDEILWYMAVLLVMGLFFSLIYQWSRNIVFPILIHGLWDWYLSLFAIKGEFSPEFAQNPGAFFGMVDFINTLITLALLLPVFYLIYRKFWKVDHTAVVPDGSPKKGMPLVRWIREKDMVGLKRPLTTTVLVTAAFCLVMLPLAAVIGVDDPALQKDRSSGGGERIVVREVEYLNVSSDLTTGENQMFVLQEEWNRTIVQVDIDLTWTDEPNANFRYRNEPDSFTLSIVDDEGSELDSGSGSSGSISLSWERNNETAGNLTVAVELTETGDQIPTVNLFGIRVIADDGNAFDLRIVCVYERIVIGGSEDLNVRW